jgi:hypothetical protein
MYMQIYCRNDLTENQQSIDAMCRVSAFISINCMSLVLHALSIAKFCFVEMLHVTSLPENR